MATVKNYGLAGLAGSVELSKGGARIKNNSGVLEARNNADDALANLSVAAPTADSHAVTKAYVDRKSDIRPVAQVINDVFLAPDGVTPYNSPNAGDIAVVTTVGVVTWDTLNRLVRYNGSTWEYLLSGGEPDGFTMQTGDAFTGGTSTFSESHVYMWEDTAWENIGPITVSYSNVQFGARSTLAYNGSSASLVASLTGRAVRAIVKVTTAWDGTEDATLTIGDDGDVDSIMASTEVDLYTVGTYIADCYVDYTATEIEFYYTNGTGDASQGALEIEFQYILD